MRKVRVLIAVSVTAGVLCACGSDSENEEPLAGPCVVNHREPVVNLDAAYGRQSGAVIGDLEITGLAVNDQTFNELELELLATAGSNISASGDSLFCTLPCQFGNEEGNWTFTATADGYLPTEQSLEASYGVFEGGCPSYYDEGSHFELQLNEEGL